jgi:sigma-B regulation protein RsbU (phosphoserine phosphatase)
VSAIRIRDPLASLLLALLLSFAEATHDSAWIWPARDAAIWLQVFLGDFFPVWMMLFGIYFPHRFRMDDRFPWAKWVVIAPFTLGSIANGLITMVWLHNIDAAIPFRPLFYAIFRTKYWLGVLAVTVFFHAMASRSFQERDKDARRRIALLWAGASAGLVPALGILVYALFTGQDPDFAKVPNRAGVSAIALMPLFPLTLAYVIVVQRAMNLRVVIRLGVKYALARHGLWILRAAFLSLPVYAAFRENLASGLVGLAVVLLVLQKAPTARVSEWLDRKFFREAYSADRVLSELSEEARQFTETGPLLETVTNRVASTLHNPKACVLLRDGENYCLANSAGGFDPVPSAVLLPARGLWNRCELRESPLSSISTI